MYFRKKFNKELIMKTVFRYLLLLSVIILPIFVLLEDAEKFPIMFGAFLGVTIAYWVGLYFVRKKSKN